MTEFPIDSQTAAPAVESKTRPMYWLVRRELWENRSVFIAPLVVAAVTFFGFLISTFGLPSRRRAVLMLPEAQQRAGIAAPYDVIAMMLVVTAFLIAFFYCLDALYSERRDRSILFWKSLPVSDARTVLSKAMIPLVVLPSLLFVIIVATQIVMAGWTTMILLASGSSSSALLATVKYFPPPLLLLYFLIVVALWHAPLYSWLLLLSAWAKRATFLWAVLPVFAISILERIAFGTSYFGQFIQWRLFGGLGQSFLMPQKGQTPPADPWSGVTPGKFLATPGLWLGLIFAAICLAVAIRLRRNREPI
jgi:ABC-2 type transport system permease protein